MDDLLPGELESAAASVQGGVVICGYGYVIGEVPTPTPAQHAELIAMSRKLGRYLDEAEVRSVLCADTAKSMLVTCPVATLLAEELPDAEYVGARESRSTGETSCND
ncbi:hypothetical protein [Rhodanobacter sp. OR92]|uniref:hypothetical protein n=1 Tax=Rhodanobacter sp. OR92 TaxID=1076524 RepID=UPI0004814158|nr:hypothetical protein [Rhodanobacter sp. OR92]